MKDSAYKIPVLIIVCAAAVFMPGAAFGGKQAQPLPGKTLITLEQAVRDGLENHMGVLNSILDEEALEAKRAIAEEQKRFTVGVSGSYLFRSVQPELKLGEMINIPGLPFSIPDQTIGTKHTYDLALGLKQPILTGGVLSSAIEMEDIRRAIQENQTGLRKIEAAGRIKTSYFTWRLLRQKRESIQKLLENLEIHNKRLELYFEEDLVRKSDLLETRRSIEETRLGLEDLTSAIRSAKREFERLCGHSPEEIAEGYREEERDKEASLDHFRNTHPLIEILDRQVELTFVQEKMINGRYSPQLFSFAELHFGKPGIDFFQNEWSLYFQGGISLSIPVFQWGQRKNELAVVGVQARKIRNQKDHLLKDVEQRLDQLFMSRSSILEKLAHVEKLIQLTGEDAVLKRQLYEEDQLSNIEYLSALKVQERYQSLRDELLFQLQIVYVSINSLTGYGGGV